MDMQRRALLQVGAAALALQVLTSWAVGSGRRYALLIGVSALQYQPRALWLKGPVNDVGHMQQALRAHGFAAADQDVLADDGQGSPRSGSRRPDRLNILAACKAMTDKLRRGDVVVLYWSGHAIRAEGPAKVVAEPDGKSTFLLATDAQRLPFTARHAWPLKGAVADAELGAAIDDWLDVGAHVLVVMDVCYAASATRAADEAVLWRGLRVADLQELSTQGTPQDQHVTLAVDLPAVLPVARTRSYGYVGLYACEAMQRTPEWSLDGQPQGVFTHAVTQALLSTKPMKSYADVARRALDLHTRLSRTAPVPQSLWPAPVFEGSLQSPLWTATSMLPWDSRSDLLGPDDVPLRQHVEVQLNLQMLGGQRKLLNLGRLRSSTQFLGRLPVGTEFVLQVFNRSNQALYLRIFHVGEKGRWQVIYPERPGDTPELPAASSRGVASWQRTLVIDKAENQPESLLWVLASADAQQRIADAAWNRLPQQAWRRQLVWQSVAP